MPAELIERAGSDDAQSIDETIFHGEARAAVIAHVRPNSLGVGGAEFQVKRNPAGEGAFVYDPRTRFGGTERLLVWWVLDQEQIYPLNAGAKLVTPELDFPRVAGVSAPETSEVVEYVFRGGPAPTNPAAAALSRPSPSATFTVREYRLYHAVMSAPMTIPEAEAVRRAGEQYDVTTAEVSATVDKVLRVLTTNKWFGSPEAEIRNASDWDGEVP